jgi:hypothetical protein
VLANDSLFVYRIGSDGALQAAAGSGSPFALGAPNHAALGVGDEFRAFNLSPAGTNAYLLRNLEGDLCRTDGDITLRAVNPVTGMPGPATGVFATGVVPRQIAFAPSGRFAYVASSGDPVELYGPCPTGSVTAYAVDPQSGALSPLPGSPFLTPRRNSAISVSPSGSFAYVLQQTPASNERRPDGRPTLVQLALDATSGRPTVLGQVEFGPNRSEVLRTLSLDPLDRFIWVFSDDIHADPGEYHVWTFRVGGTGPLRLMGPPLASPWTGLEPPSIPVVEPSGRFAYRTYDSTVEGYSIDDATGALSPIPRALQTLAAPASDLLLVTIP